MRRSVVLVLALVATAHAEDADDADDADDAQLDLVPRTAKLRLTRHTVGVEARYELDVFGPLPPPGSRHMVSLPHDAVITGAVVHANGRTQRLELAAATDADKRLEALIAPPTRTGGRMSAIRIDATGDEATIDFAFPRRTHVQLDLTLEVPTCFTNDARHILIPDAWRDLFSGGGSPVSGTDADFLSDACGADHDTKVWLAFGSRELAKQPGGAQRLGTYGSRVPLGKSDVAHIELALAKQLSEIPRDLHTVIVVDHSRSLTAEELDKQRIVVAAYLRAAPRGRVQLVGYARHGRTLLPGWALASQAGTRIDRELRALAPRNGSAVDQGLATAATLLANVTGTRRIVLFTDDRFADSVTNHQHIADLANGLPANTLVHVVSLRGFAAGLDRDDSHELSALAARTEGVAMRAQLDDHGTIDALSLARAVSVDHLEFKQTGWTEVSARSCPDPFVEGSSCEWTAHGAAGTGPVSIQGFLWGTRLVRGIEPDPREARALARFMMSKLEQLPDALAAPIQRAAQAVNGAWSMLAMWGSGGYGDLETWGTIGTGSYGTTSRDHVDVTRHPPAPIRRPTEEVLAQLGPAVRRCKPTGTIRVTVELTKEEIVDVTLAFNDPRDVSKHDCIADGIWDTALVILDAPAHVSVHIEVQP